MTKDQIAEIRARASSTRTKNDVISLCDALTAEQEKTEALLEACEGLLALAQKFHVGVVHGADTGVINLKDNHGRDFDRFKFVISARAAIAKAKQP